MASNTNEASIDSKLVDASDGEGKLEIDAQVTAWLKERVAAEIVKIKGNGGNAIPMSVTNMCIVREEKDIINRVEMDTKFDFNLIKHILISDAIKCPFKPGFVYVNVLLFTDKPLPIIIPYLYRREKANKLNEWLLINADGVRVRHHVDSFQ